MISSDRTVIENELNLEPKDRSTHGGPETWSERERGTEGWGSRKEGVSACDYLLTGGGRVRWGVKLSYNHPLVNFQIFPVTQRERGKKTTQKSSVVWKPRVLNS